MYLCLCTCMHVSVYVLDRSEQTHLIRDKTNSYENFDYKRRTKLVTF